MSKCDGVGEDAGAGESVGGGDGVGDSVGEGVGKGVCECVSVGDGVSWILEHLKHYTPFSACL